MRDSGYKKYLLLLAAVLCIFAGQTSLDKTVRVRDEYKLVARSSKEGVPPEYILTSALLGGFRGIFLTTLWIRAQNMKNEGKFHEMVQIYNVITKLEPNFPNAWAFIAWDLSFNVSVEFTEEPADRVFWVFRGVDMLRKQGIPNNPEIPHLYTELSWIFHFKIGEDTDFAHPLYRSYLARQMTDILAGLRPQDWEFFQNMSTLPKTKDALFRDQKFADAAEELSKAGYNIFADSKRFLQGKLDNASELMKKPEISSQVRVAGLWQIAKRLREEVNLEPRIMYEICRKYGAIDWRLPHAHALYWAIQARDVFERQNPAAVTLKYERLIYFSLIKLVERGKMVVSPDGMVYGVPNYEFWDRVVEHMDALVKKYKTRKRKDGSMVTLTGVMSGYENYLRTAIISANFDGRVQQAEKLLKKLSEIAVSPDQFKVPLQVFIKNSVGEWLNAMSKDRAIALMNTYIVRGFWNLSTGDTKNYEYKIRWAEYVHRYSLTRWPQEERANPEDYDYTNYIPSLVVLKRDAAVRILLGQENRFTPPMVSTLVQYLRNTDPTLWQSVEAAYKKQVSMRRSGSLLMRPQQPNQ